MSSLLLRIRPKIDSKVLGFCSLDFMYAFIMKGVDAFLMLYLTQTLFFSDVEAYELIGSKGIISYTIPFILGFMSQAYLSMRLSILLGFLLMGLGCFFLCVPSDLTLAFPWGIWAMPASWPLSFGIAFLLSGYALGRPVMPLLVASSSKTTQDKHERISTMYVFGNVASFLSPLIVGIIGGKDKGWYGAIMVLGILACVCFVINTLVFSQQKLLGDQNRLKTFMLALLGPILVGCFFIYDSYVRWALYAVTVLAFITVRRIYKRSSETEKKLIHAIIMIWITMILYFALQSQEYFMFPLYIERYVHRDFGLFELKTPWFHAISPLSVIFLTPYFTWAFRRLANKGTPMTPFGKVYGALLALAGTYLCIYASTYFNEAGALLVACGYVFVTMGEILLVPSAQQLISQFKEERVQRLLMGGLYLVMAYARLLMAQVGVTITYYLGNKKGTFEGFQDSFSMMLIVASLAPLGYTILYWFLKKSKKKA